MQLILHAVYQSHTHTLLSGSIRRGQNDFFFPACLYFSRCAHHYTDWQVMSPADSRWWNIFLCIIMVNSGLNILLDWIIWTFVNVSRLFMSERYQSVDETSQVSCLNFIYAFFFLFLFFWCWCWLCLLLWLHLEMVCINPIRGILAFRQCIAWVQT